MIKHIENCTFDQELPFHVQQLAHHVENVLERPIAADAINIVGTSPSKTEIQVYGWKSPIAPHADNTGLIFFMPILMRSEQDTLVYGDQEIELQLGHLYLMDDRNPHSTIGQGNVIALFLGPFKNGHINDELIERVSTKFLDYLS